MQEIKRNPKDFDSNATYLHEENKLLELIKGCMFKRKTKKKKKGAF